MKHLPWKKKTKKKNQKGIRTIQNPHGLSRFNIQRTFFFSFFSFSNLPAAEFYILETISKFWIHDNQKQQQLPLYIFPTESARERRRKNPFSKLLRENLLIQITWERISPTGSNRCWIVGQLLSFFKVRPSLLSLLFMRKDWNINLRLKLLVFGKRYFLIFIVPSVFFLSLGISG